MLFNKFIENQFRLNSPRLKPETRRSIQWVIDKLDGFGRWECDKIDRDWVRLFDGHLIGQGLNNNSIVIIHQKIRSFIREAVVQGFIKSDPYINFRAGMLQPVTVYLTDEELDRIYELKDLNKHFSDIRDAFIICAYTSLRKSDVEVITRGNLVRKKIGEDKCELLQIIVKKTDEKLFIPIHPRVREILDRHKWNFRPNLFHHNEYIKRIAKMAGIEDTIIVNRKKGDRFEVISKKKWQLVQFHTGRRSAATNMYKMGIDKTSIMKITGHRREATFMKYIRISSEENALKLTSHEYFSGRKQTI